MLSFEMFEAQWNKNQILPQTNKKADLYRNFQDN